jgi:hypothetical protein
MNLKTKALIYNMIAFMSLFFVLRYLVLGYIIQTDGLWLAVIAAVISSLVAPKFIVASDQGKEKLLMKTIFSKDIREL